MSGVEDRFERLERRVEQLEALLRQVLARIPGSPKAEVPPAPTPAAPATPPAEFPHRADIVTGSLRPDFDLEDWVGRRGLLVVGVVALLATGAFFLDYAFEHHWIPPLVRSIIAVAAGAGLAVWGHTLIRRGMRKYGGPVIGAGGGLIYLGIWAAAGPFALVDRRAGIIALAVVATVLALLAQRYEIEGLAISAILGAFAAPLVLKTPVPNPHLFLGYTELIGIGGGVVAYAMDWRPTMIIACVGYMLLAALVLSLDNSIALVQPVGLTFLVAGAVLGSQVSRRKLWWEARMIMALGAWLLLAAGMPDQAPDPVRWAAVAAMTAICGTFFFHLRDTRAFGDRATSLLPEALLYLLTPLVLTTFVLGNRPALIDGRTAIVPAVIALPYVLDGWINRRGHGLAVGVGLWAWAILIQFDAVGTVAGWATLAAVAAMAHLAGRRPGLTKIALTVYASSAVALFTYALLERPHDGPPFSDPWALALYAVLAAGALIIWCWRTYVDAEAEKRHAVWWMAGSALFLGISVNIVAFFDQRSGAGLAGKLALSVWWLVFAAMLVAVGFRRSEKAVRSAGLAVAVAATVKVLLYDLSELQALYRIGAFFALALIALGVAFAYHKQGSVEKQGL
ncbi:MAG TPA: DUF2339 domain-containing protein [Gemmatimonadales bacterium]|nr:DUF2339 domain-containing protein [Gemmatimonadales bacterium]